MTQCTLRNEKKKKKSERCEGVSLQNDTVHRNKECYVDGDCSVDCEKTVLCVFAYQPPKSCTQQLHASCDTEQGGGEKKAQAALAALLMHVPSFVFNQCVAQNVLLAPS